MSRELIVGSQVPLSLQQFYLTKENLKIFYNLEGIQWRPWRPDPILNSLAESNHKLQHTFSKYQFAIILEVEVALKTTLRASSQQGSGLSITTVSCSIIIRYLRGSALALFMQSWFIETLVVSCTANLWNFSSFRGDFLFLQTKDPIRTHHELILTVIKVRGDKMTNYWGLQIGKPSLTCCVPVLLRVSRRFKQENILLDVVKWVVSQSIKKHGLFYNFWSISRYSLN